MFFEWLVVVFDGELCANRVDAWGGGWIYGEGMGICLWVDCQLFGVDEGEIGGEQGSELVFGVCECEEWEGVGVGLVGVDRGGQEDQIVMVILFLFMIVDC